VKKLYGEVIRSDMRRLQSIEWLVSRLCHAMLAMKFY